MRALVIAPQPFFSPRGTPFSVYYRTLVMAQLGVDIDLLTYGEGQDVQIPGVRLLRIPRFSFLGPVKVGPSALKLFLDVVLLLWTVGLLLRRRYDFVHAHEESVFFCRWLKPLFRFKLVYDMHSSLPQQLTNFNFTTARPLIALFEKLENAALRHAEAVITICPDLFEYAAPRMPDPSRCFLIENSLFDEVCVAGASSQEVATPPPLPLPEGRPVVVYAGTFERYQGLDLLIPAVAKVRRTRPDVFLLLIGGSPEQVAQFRRLADESGLNGDCLFTGRLPQRLAQHYAQRATVLTSPRSNGTNTPLKVYEQLASGIPLVATRIHSHTQVLNDEVCFLVEPSADAMAAGILAALSDERRRAQVAARARRLYEERYARPVYVSKMRQLLDVLR